MFGSIAILGMYALVRAAGGGPWLGLGAAALMACDNLLLVHGRIGTLDIYAVATMIWARGALPTRPPDARPALVLGIGAAFKEVAPYLLISLVLLELGRCRAAARGGPDSWRPRPAPLAAGDRELHDRRRVHRACSGSWTGSRRRTTRRDRRS